MSGETSSLDPVDVDRSASLPRRLYQWALDAYFSETLRSVDGTDRLLIYGGLGIVGGLAMVVLSFAVNPVSFIAARAVLYGGGALVYAGVATWFVHATLLGLSYISRIERGIGL